MKNKIFQLAPAELVIAHHRVYGRKTSAAVANDVSAKRILFISIPDNLGSDGNQIPSNEYDIPVEKLMVSCSYFFPSRKREVIFCVYSSL
ncbi:MAG: hypothetical protein WCH65_03660 [bacterium]